MSFNNLMRSRAEEEDPMQKIYQKDVLYDTTILTKDGKLKSLKRDSTCTDVMFGNFNNFEEEIKV